MSRRGGPCQGAGLYEVDVPSAVMIASSGTVVCNRHLAEVVDEAWAEIDKFVAEGVIGPGIDVHVRRTPGAPRVPPLWERVAQTLGDG